MKDKMDLNDNFNGDSALRNAAEKKLGRSLDLSPELKDLTSEKIMHELRVHQIELEMQNDELKRVQLALEESRDKYQDLYDFSPVGYFTLTHNGIIREANLTGAILLGMPRPKLINMRFGHFVASESDDQWYRHLISALGHVEKQTCFLTLKRDDGSSFYARLESIRMNAPAQPQGETDHRFIIRIAVSDITEAKRMEESLRESERQRDEDNIRDGERLRAITDHAFDGIILVNDRGEISSWNPAAERIFGHSSSEAMGKNVHDLLAPQEYLPTSFSAVREFAVSGLGNALGRITQLVGRRKDGEKFPIELSLSSFQMDGSWHAAGIARDISKNKRAEEALRESEKKYRLLAENTQDVIWQADLNLAFTYVNPAIVQMTGYTPDEWIGSRLAEHCDQENFTKMAQVASAAISTDSGSSDIFVEAVILKKNKESFPVEIVGKALFDENGNPFCLQGVTRDITERKKTEKALFESEQRYRSLFEGSRDGIVLIDMEGRFKEFNARYLEMLGYSAEELLVKTYKDITPARWETDEDRIVAEQIISRGYSDIYEKEYICKDGTSLHVELTVFLIKKDSENVGMWAIVRDITERKISEDELRRSEQNFKMIVENSAIPMVISAGKQEKIEYLNPKFTDLFGYTKEDISEVSDWWPLAYPEKEYRRSVSAEWNRKVEAAIEGRTQIEPMDVVVECKDGSKKNIAWSMVSTGDRNIIFGIDNTDRQRWEQERLEMERKLLHAQKLESLGVMAGGIAHDFNNLLMAIMGGLDFALDDPTLTPTTRSSIEIAMKASEKSAELSRQMLIYSGSGFYTPSDMDLGEVTYKNEDLFKSAIPKTTTLNLEISEGLPLIRGDEDQIQRIITNLVLNASEAIGDNTGQVTIRTGVMDCDEAYLSRSRLQEKPPPGRLVFLEVRDTGCGMDAETQHRLFDPFFSTKFWGRGLGMAEVMGIVKGHHGAIIVESEPEKGTTTRVLFPSSENAHFVETKDVVETQPSVPLSPTTRKTILVVEDAELVRGLVLNRLAVLGYDTIAAVDGVEGIRIFHERLNEIDLVLLDFAMPRMNGVEAFGELIRIRPDVKVILSSGYTENVVIRRFPGPKPSGFLNKPYKLEVMKAELDRLLGADG